MTTPPTFPRHLADFPTAGVLWDFCDADSGLRTIVVRGFMSFCAYIGVTEERRVALPADFRPECHRTITFSGSGSADSNCPAGWYWWGWDYGSAFDVKRLPHSAHRSLEELLEVLPEQDREQLRAMLPGRAPSPRSRSKDWTVDEVREEALDVLMATKQALR
ncbi:hypothetical protein G3A43_07150 [Paraburkholderia aspalathi]|nr:hypothetical protein [Paraburkholderia aspalathi]MBK3780029.1 hypothetical protein [Paraburkholderia aspalathi]